MVRVISNTKADEKDKEGEITIIPRSRCPDRTCAFNIFGFCQTIPDFDWANSTQDSFKCKTYTKPRVKGELR